MLNFVTTTFDPKIIFEWCLFHWKVGILVFKLNINLAWFGFILSELWSFKFGPSMLLGIKGVWAPSTMRAHHIFQVTRTSVLRAQNIILWCGLVLDSWEHLKASKKHWKPLIYHINTHLISPIQTLPRGSLFLCLHIF